MSPVLDELRLLGPIRVLRDGVDLLLGGHQQRALLAVLAINRNRTVPVSAIIDAVWEDEPPATATSIVQVYVSALRRILGAASALHITTAAPGYQLTLEDRQCDVARFQAALLQADAAATRGSWPDAASGYRIALAEWRGPALADLQDLAFARSYVAALDQERLHTLQARIEADLACGQHAAVIAELVALTHDYPLRERFWQQLILALYRCGQQADALSAYKALREVLNRELGIDPSPPLQQLEQAVLRHDDLLQAAPLSTQLLPDLERTITDDDPRTGASLLDGQGRRVPISAEGLHIGRLPSNDLVLDDAKTSRQHAVIISTSIGFFLSDLHSRNGTYVANTRVTDNWNLTHGDQIRIGDTVLTFYLEDAT
ncbi:MAG: BTAD domain-containing putative transcriptional regulator [Jatrophihabitans sp.]